MRGSPVRVRPVAQNEKGYPKRGILFILGIVIWTRTLRAPAKLVALRERAKVSCSLPTRIASHRAKLTRAEEPGQWLKKTKRFFIRLFCLFFVDISFYNLIYTKIEDATASSILLCNTILLGYTNTGYCGITPSKLQRVQELRRTLGAQRRSWCWFVHRDQQRYLRYR